MLARRAILAVLFIAILAGVVSSQSLRKKKDHLAHQGAVELDYADKVYADKEIAARIPVGLIQSLMNRPRNPLESEFADLLNKPGVTHQGWSYQIQHLETAGPETTITVNVSPRVYQGGATTVCGVIEEVHRFESGKLTLISSKISGSPTATIID